jgi:hypothetical protein
VPHWPRLACVCVNDGRGNWACTALAADPLDARWWLRREINFSYDGGLYGELVQWMSTGTLGLERGAAKIAAMKTERDEASATKDGVCAGRFAERRLLGHGGAAGDDL